MNQAATEFHRKVLSFFQVNPGMCFVIEAAPTEGAGSQAAARDAWFAYLQSKGLTSTLSTWKAILGGLGKAITVPCERPELFDLTYVPRNVVPFGRHREAAE